jgi:hypothetical protein
MCTLTLTVHKLLLRKGRGVQLPGRNCVNTNILLLLLLALYMLSMCSTTELHP